MRVWSAAMVASHSPLECSVSAELWICRGATFFGGRELGTTLKSKGCAKESKAGLTPRTPKLFPFAGELEGALADWLGEGLVRRDGGETFARGLALGSQTVEQTQGLTSGSPRARNDESKTSLEAWTNIATALVCLQILSEMVA